MRKVLQNRLEEKKWNVIFEHPWAHFSSSKRKWLEKISLTVSPKQRLILIKAQKRMTSVLINNFLFFAFLFVSFHSVCLRSKDFLGFSRCSLWSKKLLHNFPATAGKDKLLTYFPRFHNSFNLKYSLSSCKPKDTDLCTVNTIEMDTLQKHTNLLCYWHGLYKGPNGGRELG